MNKIVLINIGFKDAYTGEEYTAGHTTVMSQERIAEVKEIDKNLISVIGNAEEKENAAEVALACAMNELEVAKEELELTKSELETARTEAEAANAEVEKLKKELEKAKKAEK